MPLEDFMKQIKSHWIERVTFTRNSKPFSIKASSLPPIIAPKLAGPVIWNSELKKKSAYLGDGNNKVKGKLHFLHGHFADYIQPSYHIIALHHIVYVHISLTFAQTLELFITDVWRNNVYRESGGGNK